MHWIHSSRQGWLVVATGMALMGGCGPALADPAAAPEQAARPADAPASAAPQPAGPPDATDGLMTLHAGL